MNNVLEIIKKNFTSYRAIFERDLIKLGLSKLDIESALQENVFEEVKYDFNFDFGKVYTLVEYINELEKYYKRSKLALEDLEYFFTGKNFEFGYYSGFQSLNKIRLSNQVCLDSEVSSTLVNSEIKFDTYNGTIVVKPVKDSNLYIMYAEAINNYFDYFDISKQELNKLFRDLGLDESILSSMINKGVLSSVFA